MNKYYDVPEGWHPLIAMMYEELKEEGYDVKKISYMKEKYGTLSIECSGRNDILGGAERASSYICQDCSSVGRLRTDLGWYRTLCPECYLKYKKQ